MAEEHPPSSNVPPHGPDAPGPDAPGPGDHAASPHVPPPPPGGTGARPATGDAAPEPMQPDKDACTMAMLAHLLGIFLGPMGPLVIWLIKKDESPFVDSQGKEALNFQLTLLIAYAVSFLLVCVYIGVFTALAAWVCSLVFGIQGTMAANSGQPYRYPISLRMIT